MIRPLLAFFLRQTALAATALVGLLLLAEILAPSSVLPFFNLHAVILLVLALHAAVLALPSDELGSLPGRLALATPCAILLVFTVWVALAGAGNSAMLLVFGVCVLIVSFSIAIVQAYAKY